MQSFSCFFEKKRNKRRQTGVEEPAPTRNFVFGGQSEQETLNEGSGACVFRSNTRVFVSLTLFFRSNGQCFMPTTVAMHATPLIILLI